MEHSPIIREKSKNATERPSMSAADDVIEMKGICNELADRIAGIGAQMQTRVTAVLRAINTEATQPISGNRALEFLKGRARIVQAWEKDNAKRQLEEIKERERTARDNAHLAWLECEIARHRAAGTEFRGAHVDGLLDLLRCTRDATSPVAVPSNTSQSQGEIE
jgi:hypothetical protein